VQTNFITGTGKNHRTTQLRQVCDALRPEKAASGGIVVAIHGLGGSDNTGRPSLAGNWKQLLEGISRCN